MTTSYDNDDESEEQAAPTADESAAPEFSAPGDDVVATETDTTESDSEELVDEFNRLVSEPEVVTPEAASPSPTSMPLRRCTTNTTTSTKTSSPRRARRALTTDPVSGTSFTPTPDTRTR